MNHLQDMTYGVAPYETLQAMSGLEFLSAIRDGQLPQAPIAKVLGFHMAEVEEGAVTFIGTPAIDQYNPIGSVHGGWYGAMLDSCMACAVQTTLAQGTGYTTVEYSVNLGPRDHSRHRCCARRRQTRPSRASHGNGRWPSR